jgi:hypothetical protein
MSEGSNKIFLRGSSIDKVNSSVSLLKGLSLYITNLSPFLAPPF